MYFIRFIIVTFKVVCVLFLILVLSSKVHCQSKYNANLSITRKNARCISLVSDDFIDLQFLKDEIAEKRIVWLGENNHLTKENNIVKFRLIKFLHQQMGFNVVIFESGSGNCGISNLGKTQMNPFELLYTSILGAWRSKDNCLMMEFFKQDNVDLVGMDPNFKSRYLPKRVYKYIFSQNAKLAVNYFLLDSLNTYLHVDMTDLYHSKGSKKEKNLKARELNIRSDSIKMGYNHILQTIVLQDLHSDIQSKKALRIIKLGLINNVYDLSKDLTKFKFAESYWVTNSERDSLMARNLAYLIDSIYVDQKVIIWAHNSHIKRIPEELNKVVPFNTINFFLPEKMKKESFIIALFADSNNNRCSKYSVFNIGRELQIGTFYLNTKMFTTTYKLNSTDFWTQFLCPVCKKTEIVSQTLTDCYDSFIYIPNTHKSKLLYYDPYKKYNK